MTAEALAVEIVASMGGGEVPAVTAPDGVSSNLPFALNAAQGNCAGGGRKQGSLLAVPVSGANGLSVPAHAASRKSSLGTVSFESSAISGKTLPPIISSEEKVEEVEEEDRAKKKSAKNVLVSSRGKSKHKGKNKHILAILGGQDSSRDVLENQMGRTLSKKRASRRENLDRNSTEPSEADGLDSSKHEKVRALFNMGGKAKANKMRANGKKGDDMQDLFKEVQKQARNTRRSSMGEVSAETRRNNRNGASSLSGRMATNLKLQLQVAQSSAIEGIRENSTLDFPGRIVNGQKFCVYSFPGIYEVYIVCSICCACPFPHHPPPPSTNKHLPPSTIRMSGTR
jgi:hypothetical protein